MEAHLCGWYIVGLKCGHMMLDIVDCICKDSGQC